MNGEQYLANTSPSKKEVHDLDNEKTGCQIDDIIKAKARQTLYISVCRECRWL
jgi:cell division protein FtsB